MLVFSSVHVLRSCCYEVTTADEGGMLRSLAHAGELIQLASTGKDIIS